MKKYFLSAVVLASVMAFGAGCTDTPSVDTNTASIPTTGQTDQTGGAPVVTSTSAMTSTFDPSVNKPGDVVAGFTLTSVNKISNIPGQLGPDNVDAVFSGTSTVTGSYDYSKSEFSGDDMVCMTLTDPAQAAKIPQLAGKNYDDGIGFCFRNTKQAIQLLGPSYGQGTATVTVANYELQNAPAEVLNLADLVAVSSKTPKVATLKSILVSTQDPAKYCNGAQMDSDGFRKTLTKEKPISFPANATQDEIAKDVVVAATSGMCKQVLQQVPIKVVNGVLRISPIDGWAGISIAMCSCKPQVEVNAVRIPGVTSVAWE
jgi:hypothetical protein